MPSRALQLQHLSTAPKAASRRLHEVDGAPCGSSWTGRPCPGQAQAVDLQQCIYACVANVSNCIILQNQVSCQASGAGWYCCQQWIKAESSGQMNRLGIVSGAHYCNLGLGLNFMCVPGSLPEVSWLCYNTVMSVQSGVMRPTPKYPATLLKSCAHAHLPVRCLFAAHTFTSCQQTPPSGSPPFATAMALLSSASLRTCARPTAAPRAAVVAPRVIVCRAQTNQEEALKMAQDLLSKGMDAAKSVDVNAVRCVRDPKSMSLALDQFSVLRVH